MLPFSGVQVLRVSGMHMPARFPPHMVHIAVLFHHSRDWDVHTPNMLLGNLTYHQALRRVTIIMAPQVFSMADSFILPKLDCIELHFRVGKGFAERIDLGWLTKQPYQALTLAITFHSGRLSDHKGLVSWLQQLSIQTLYLSIQAQLCPEVQELWSRVTATQACELNAASHGRLCLAALSSYSRITCRIRPSRPSPQFYL